MSISRAVRPTITDLLDSARSAAAKNDLGAALQALLDTWRQRPVDAIAAAIDAVGARAQASLSPPTGKTAKDRNAAWDEAARGGDPCMRGVLVDSLAKTKGNLETLARIELLVAHAPDPRLSARIGDFIEKPIYNASDGRTAKFWRRLFELLPSLGDPRLLERARGFSAAWGNSAELTPSEIERLERRLAKVLPALETAYGDAENLSPDEEALCGAVIAAIRPPSSSTIAAARTEEGLLEAIYAAPDDDGPRLVYADFLQERLHSSNACWVPQWR